MKLKHFATPIGKSLQSTLDECIPKIGCMVLMPPHSQSIRLPEQVVAACMPVSMIHVLSFPDAKVFSIDGGMVEQVRSVGRYHRSGEEVAKLQDSHSYADSITISNQTVKSRLGLRPYPMIFHTGKPFSYWHGDRCFNLGVIGIKSPELDIQVENIKILSPPILITGALGNVITGTNIKLDLSLSRWARIIETGQIGELVGSTPCALLGCEVQVGQHLELVQVENIEREGQVNVQVVDEDWVLGSENSIGSMGGVMWSGVCGGERLPRNLRLSIK